MSLFVHEWEQEHPDKQWMDLTPRQREDHGIRWRNEAQHLDRMRIRFNAVHAELVASIMKLAEQTL